MKTGDFVSIDYIGRVKDTGEIFDVTMEDAAKQNKVYDSHVVYRPINVVVGANFVIKGLDEILMQMNVGEKKTVVVEPDKAFGPRNPDYIKPIPLASFKGQNIDPTPGSYITINNVRGRIVSADGGRVRVDFNHPLAGKKLEYEIEVRKEITDTEEKVKAVVGYMTGIVFEKIHAKVNGTEAEIKVDAKQELPANAKKNIADLAIKWVKGIEKVRFVDEYSGEKKSEEKKPEAKPQ